MTGTCGTGTLRAYLDEDGDGVGAGPLDTPCFPVGQVPTTHALSDTDCAPNDSTAFELRVVPADADGDGVTAPLERCVGTDTPERVPAPSISYYPMVVESVANGNDVTWYDPQYAKRTDGETSYCRPGDGTPCQPLRLTDFALRIPADATIRGIVVHVVRRASADGTDVRDSAISLVLNGAVVSQARAHPEPWGDTLRHVTYGGATDDWGRTFRADEVNGASFGFQIVAKNDLAHADAVVEHAWVEVFHDMGGDDCAPNDPAGRSVWLGYPDPDKDGFGVPPAMGGCVGDMPPLQRAERDRDCDNDDARAHPYQLSFFGTPRTGVGGFDFNCNAQVEKGTVRNQITCGSFVNVCLGSFSVVGTVPNQACGQDTTVDRCVGSPPNCSLQPTAIPVPCR